MRIEEAVSLIEAYFIKSNDPGRAHYCKDNGTMLKIFQRCTQCNILRFNGETEIQSKMIKEPFLCNGCLGSLERQIDAIQKNETQEVFSHAMEVLKKYYGKDRIPAELMPLKASYL